MINPSWRSYFDEMVEIVKVAKSWNATQRMQRIAAQPRTHADLNPSQAFVRDRVDARSKGLKSAKNWAQAGKGSGFMDFHAFRGNVYGESGQVARTFSAGNLNKALETPGSLRKVRARSAAVKAQQRRRVVRPTGTKAVHTVAKPSLLNRIIRGVARRKLKIG